MYLFIFAHPDDESVACGGTIARLRAAGETVFLATVTDGASGEVLPAAWESLAKHNGNIGKLRMDELYAAAEKLGVEKKFVRCLHFPDGHITNQDVWGKLAVAITDLLDELQPEVVITFDHSGWYFHLDHVATSISTTMALFQTKYPPKVAFHAHYWIPGNKWHYAWPPSIPVTHTVDVSSVLDQKRAAVRCHVSQQLADPERLLEMPEGQTETYQLMWQSENAPEWTNAQHLFTPYHDQHMPRLGRTAILKPEGKKS